MCGSNWRTAAAVAIVVACVIGGCADGALPPVVVEPSVAQPVVWSLAVMPSAVKPANVIAVVVRARIARGWSIHPVGEAHGPSLPTKLELTLPDGIEAATDWELPPAWPAADRPDPEPVYQEDAAFKRMLIVTDKGAAGAVEIRCTVDFQACDATMCRRPETQQLSARVTIRD